MTTYPTSSLVDQVVPTITTSSPESIKKPLGTLGLGIRCWEADETIRNYFHSKLKPEILQHLDGIFGSVSTRDSIIIVAYIVGKRSFSAAPTVLFISENDSHRKAARKFIRDSGMLKQHRGWKTAHAPKDPGWGAKLEQLALGQGSKTNGREHEPVSQVLYDTSKPLRSEGMTVYIPHGSSLRTATANLIRVHGQMFYLTTAHAFFDRANAPKGNADEFTDEFEVDSDDEDATMHGDKKTDGLKNSEVWSSSGESMELDPFFSCASDDDDTYSQSSFGSNVLMGIGGAAALHGTATEASSESIETGLESTPQEASEDATFVQSFLEFTKGAMEEKPTQSTSSDQETEAPSLATLRPLGVLSRWSTDKDWALIAIASDSDSELAAFLAADQKDLSAMLLARCNTEGGFVLTHTTSGGKMTGTMLSTISDYRPPYGKSFQQVYSVRLDGHLADGDCGSAVTDATTGALYGHIVAGCRETGFAYVIAAHHVFPDLQKGILQEPDFCVIAEIDTSDKQIPDTRQPLDTKKQSVVSANAANAILNASETMPYNSRFSDREKALRFERPAWFQDTAGKNLEILSGHAKVAVLMIHWEDAIDDENANNAEVEQLRRVFERFGFGCDDVKLSTKDEHPQSSLNKAVSNHVSTHDDPDNLLIVYYSSQRITTGGDQATQSKTRIRSRPSKLRHISPSNVSWDVAEAPLLSSSADVLTILDCYSTSTAAPRTMSNRKVYERLSLGERPPYQYRVEPVSPTRVLRQSFEALLEEGLPSLTASHVQLKFVEIAQMSPNIYRPSFQREIRRAPMMWHQEQKQADTRLQQSPGKVQSCTTGTY